MLSLSPVLTMEGALAAMEVAGGPIRVAPVDLTVGVTEVGLVCRPSRRGCPGAWRRCLAPEDAGGTTAAGSRAGA